MQFYSQYDPRDYNRESSLVTQLTNDLMTAFANDPDASASPLVIGLDYDYRSLALFEIHKCTSATSCAFQISSEMMEKNAAYRTLLWVMIVGPIVLGLAVAYFLAVVQNTKRKQYLLDVIV